MTIQKQLDRLTAIAAQSLASIQALERITTAHQAIIESHTAQIANLTAAHERTEASIRAMADELINTQHEWQAYLRRIPRQ
jgi:hypothetical protein